jgi:hypothetical protein
MPAFFVSRRCNDYHCTRDYNYNYNYNSTGMLAAKRRRKATS